MEMAIVANKGNVNEPIDNAYCTHTRTNAGDPNGTVVPAFAGEVILDTTTKVRWKATGTVNSTWVQMS
jgi:hypothetical protein